MSDVPSGETTAIRCLRADSRLLGQLNFGGMKKCDFWRAKRAENFPHNPTCFPHNQHFLPHNVPENFRIICYFFPHPIRCPVLTGQGSLVSAACTINYTYFVPHFRPLLRRTLNKFNMRLTHFEFFNICIT